MSNSPMASPTVHVNNWSDSQVADWLNSIHLSKYSKDFKSNGISGEVLVLLDDDALRDIGVATIGQRLSLLGAIYRLKLQFGIPIQEGDWIPKSIEAQEGYLSSSASPYVSSLLRQRDDRIRTLETQLHKFADYLNRFQQDFALVCRQVGVKPQSVEGPISLPVGIGHSHTPSDSSSTHSLSAFGSNSDLASSTSSHPIESPTSRSFPHLVSPSRLGFGSSHGSSFNLHRSAASPSVPVTASSYGHSPYSQPPHTRHVDLNASNSEDFTNSPSASHVQPSSNTFRLPTNRADTSSTITPMTPTAGTMPSHVHSASSAAGPSEISPTQHTPSVTPTSMVPTPNSAPSHMGNISSSSTQSPIRRTAHPSSSSSVSSSTTTIMAAASTLTGLRARSASITSASPNHASIPTSTSSSSSSANDSIINKSSRDQALNPLNPNGASGSSSSHANNATANTTANNNNNNSNTDHSHDNHNNDPIANTKNSATGNVKSSSSQSQGSDNNNHPYKSFRVTLDDPCHKVLPAALKKYKIVDDWRKYALFICYGSTERCLSYDEKPLLLFQKLKENNQSPVFMLRHIRDVKSPIAIAEAKKDQASSKKSKAARNDGRKVINGPLPPGAIVGNLGQPKQTGPVAELPQHKKGAKTYAVAIYPYMSERGDEFDVSVGDTFTVINKAKGWWVVQRDSKANGTGDLIYSVPVGEGEIDQLNGGSGETDGGDGSSSDYRAEIASGWVPAGCLLETSRPLGTLIETASAINSPGAGSTSTSGPTTPTVATAAAAAAVANDKRLNGGVGASDVSNTSIPPSLITSTSTPGIMLMNYKSTEDGLDLKKDERLRVFKRYNHWSYCVQEGQNHARGWVPSWYIGKGSSSSSSSSSSGTTLSTSKVVMTQSSTSSMTMNDSNTDVESSSMASFKVEKSNSETVPSSTGFNNPIQPFSSASASSAFISVPNVSVVTDQHPLP